MRNLVDDRDFFSQRRRMRGVAIYVDQNAHVVGCCSYGCGLCALRARSCGDDNAPYAMIIGFGREPSKFGVVRDLSKV